MYFRTVSEAVASKRVATAIARFRMAGEVVPGTVHETARGVNFEITDGKATVRGGPPGRSARACSRTARRWCARAAGRTAPRSTSDRILIKHGSEYKPPKVNVNDDRSRGRHPTPQAAQRREGVARSPRARARRRRPPCSASSCSRCGLSPRDERACCGSGRVTCSSSSSARSLAVGRDGVGAHQHDFSIRYVAENNARADAAAVHDHRAVGRARGIDPAVGADPRRLPRRHRAPLPPSRRRPAGRRGRRSSASSSRSSSSCSCPGRRTRSSSSRASRRPTAGVRTRCCRTTR